MSPASRVPSDRLREMGNSGGRFVRRPTNLTTPLRCLLEGLRWLWGAEAVRVVGKSGISQARTHLGEAPLRRLYDRLVRPVATCATRGAWYRPWRRCLE